MDLTNNNQGKLLLAEQSTDLNQQTYSQAGKTIFVVESHDLSREVTVEVLKEQGYRVFSAATGSECLDTLSKYPLYFDLLLTDLTMPGIDGIRLTKLLLAGFPQLKVLLMINFLQSQVFINNLNEHNFLQKPFSAKKMCWTVNKLLSTE